MSTYPQLGTGALSQYPTVKRRSQRTVWNAMADGGAIKLADPAAAVTTWRLAYTDLTDDEGAALETFFGEMEGSLRGFTFLDPGGNLLAWSGKLDEGIWQKDPALTLSGGVSDPTGGTSAWRAVNAGAAPQSLVQAIEAPGEYVYCLSVYLRATEPAPVIMRLGELRGVRAAGVGWRRAVLAGNAGAGGDGVRFGIEIPAGAGVEVFGLQAEPQAAPSAHQASIRGGVFEGARFRDDGLAITTTGPNRHSCTVNIIHANHI